MRVRGRWLLLALAFLLAVVGLTLVALPGMARRVAVARIQALTGRQAAIDAVELHLLRGGVSVRGFRLADREGGALLADFDRLDLRIDVLSLLRGRLRFRDLVLHRPTVRVVRFADRFDISDLLHRSGTATAGPPLDITVDHFALVGGTLRLEDRAVPGGRTWTSERIQIEGHNLSTRRADGTAVGTSVTAGAPTRIEITGLRLYPIHLHAVLGVQGADVGLARLYLPADAPVVVGGGRVSSTLTVALDARTGVRADGSARFEDVSLLRPGESEPAARVDELTTHLTDVAFGDGGLRLGKLEVRASGSVRDPRAGRAVRYRRSTVRATLTDLTWPLTHAGSLDLETAIPGGGVLAVSGRVEPPPAPSRLRLRLAHLELAPWAQFLPTTARVAGVAEADLRVDEAIRLGVPTRVRGTVAVHRLVVRDGDAELARARRVAATGLEVRWPTGVHLTRLAVDAPRARVERDRAGVFRLRHLVSGPGSPPVPSPESRAGSPPGAPAPSPALDAGEIVVRDGRIAWRDEAVGPPVALDVAGVQARVTGAGWPLAGPLGVRVAVQPPGGGRIELRGRVGVDPVTADVRIVATDAALDPYQPYVPVAARLGGRAALDLAVVLPPSWPEGATVRGRVALSRVDVRDEQRTVIRVEQAEATGVDVDWPRRAGVRRLVLRRPWILLERDEAAALPLRTLLLPRRPAPAAADAHADAPDAKGRMPVLSLGALVVEDGGARVVDRSLAPPFAVDLRQLAVRADGLSTTPTARPAQVELSGRPGAGALLTVRATVGPIGGPLRLETTADLRDFTVPRTNPYLLRQVGWEALEGQLSTALRCRIDGDALDAMARIRLSGLEVARPTSHDEAQARLGLPLGLIVALMKDRHGAIDLSLPVGGRLSDPRFALGEVIWSTVRNVAVKAVTLPVSWIGRIHLGSDSRIQRIDLDPVRFEPGTAVPTPEGREQLTRLAAFLDQRPAVRLALTPVVSSEELRELRRRAVEAAVERAAREGGIAPEEAAARLFEQRFPGQPRPGAPEAVRAALVDAEPGPPGGAAGLAAQRVATVRDALRAGGIDAGRLRAAPREEPPESGGQVKLDLVDRAAGTGEGGAGPATGAPRA